MRQHDTYIFANCAWSVVALRADGRVKLRLMSGPDSEPRTQIVHSRMLMGRPVYRQVNAVDDVDLDHAREEVSGDIDVSAYGDNPRKWADAFQRVYGSRPSPDATVMLGWFANCIDAGTVRERRRNERARKRTARNKARRPVPRKTSVRRPRRR